MRALILLGAALALPAQAQHADTLPWMTGAALVKLMGNVDPRTVAWSPDSPFRSQAIAAEFLDRKNGSSCMATSRLCTMLPRARRGVGATAISLIPTNWNPTRATRCSRCRCPAQAQCGRPDRRGLAQAVALPCRQTGDIMNVPYASLRMHFPIRIASAGRSFTSDRVSGERQQPELLQHRRDPHEPRAARGGLS